MARLFEINEAIEKCFKVSESEVVDTETGEVLDIDYLNSLEMEKNSIIKYLLQKVLNEDSDAKAYEAQKKIFDAKQKAAEKRRDSIKGYLSAVLNGNSFEADDKSVKATFRRTESVNIVDLAAVPVEFKKKKEETVADKVAIKAAFKEGRLIDGAELITTQNIQVK